ncbi:ABC transporter substrate-binding protein [Hyphococcus flavus]|uniref:ABC transporter substrate-binding protein n=1 Tax=Hyphococcus flavus TaxID=1866326 RepID=A0AAF0CG68_9PROT|nr:ABC transporter substrate-binding protein [Hyphococcus flavus]WDI30372.1 ABC transporter substrate-binding protein [Hyphococcus flavus]
MRYQSQRRSFLKYTLAASAALFAIGQTTAFADQAAEDFVQGILDEAEPILDAPTQQELLDGVENLVAQYVDMRRIGRFVLGQYARQMTDAQAEEYFPLFQQYATIIYQNTLSDYEGQRIVVTGSVDRSERDIIVNSKLANPEPGAAFANAVIHWRVYRDRDGNMSVVDAGADNVWLAIEQRSQFTSLIANNGGGAAGIDALIAEIRSRVNED